ncbi:HAMP domain-containing sensor histidine kinase, partial [Patulibacter sp.]|uniref:HAMP domain-containing sensor histidine kinase n=1 Tax=Patulibacter sp. TaxID=1912859 RepID=UPI00272285E9
STSPEPPTPGAGSPSAGGSGGSGAPAQSGGSTAAPGGTTAVPVAPGRLLGPADQRLGDEVALVRILQDGTVTERLGSVADPGLPARADDVPATVQAGGAPWRIVQRPISDALVVQAAAPLGPVDARAATLRDRVAVAGVLGVAATLLIAFLLVGAVLRALGRLRRTAAEVAVTADLATRVDATRGPQEIRELSSTLNAMLARLEDADGERRAALEATRRFAADAGHELRTPLATIGAGVQTLADHPELEGPDRDAAFHDVRQEHRRVVALLESLQTLARGDAAGRLEREPVDLVELVEEAVASVRRSAPDGTAIELHAPSELVREAWPPGVRIAVENLLRNAVAHGRPAGAIAVTVEQAGGEVRITVDDDGPGIPPEQRDRLRERFARGASADTPGSGLGLAIVEQQAGLHGGRLELTDAPAGGLRARLVLDGVPRT